jgi:hypothetical protein
MRRGPGGRKFFFLSFFVNFSSLFFVSLAFVLEKKKKTDHKQKNNTHPPGGVLHRDPQVAPRQECFLKLDDVRVAEVGVVDELALDVLKREEKFFYCCCRGRGRG